MAGHARRSRLAALTAAAGLVLSGCAAAGGQDEPELSEARKKGPELFGVPASRLPFGPGPWDMEAPDFDQFNPCTEIPPEAYRAAGLQMRESLFEDGKIGDTVTCSVTELGETATSAWENGYFQIGSDLVPMDQMGEVGFPLVEVDEGRTFRPHFARAEITDGGCISGIETNRGRWEVFHVQPASGAVGWEESCKAAREVHERLTQAVGEF